MLGTVLKQLKSHPASRLDAYLSCVAVGCSVVYHGMNSPFKDIELIPLFVFIGGGAGMSVLYLCRLALKNPDCSWDRKNNPEPWNKLGPNDQYKLFAVNMDYSKLRKDRPDF